MECLYAKNVVKNMMEIMDQEGSVLINVEDSTHVKNRVKLC